MSEILWKSDLQQSPFEVNPDTSDMFTSIYPFADAWETGGKPLTIPDLVGSHDITMVYGTNGGLIGDGALLLSDNGNGSLNTYGSISTLPIVSKNSCVVLVDTFLPQNTHTSHEHYLLECAGFYVYWKSTTSQLYVSWTSANGHKMEMPHTDIGLVVGDRLTLALCMDFTNDVAHLVINGTAYALTKVGDPWYGGLNATPTSYTYIGRHYSWNNYYGWSEKLNLLAFGFGLEGREPTEQDLIDITLNPYSILKRSEDKLQEFGLKLSTAGQSISIPFVGAYDINLTDSDDVVTNYTGSGTFVLDGTTPIQIKLIVGTHDNGYEVFNFNKTDGETVTSVTSALVCTLLGLPSDSGYVRDEATGQLVGYRTPPNSSFGFVFSGLPLNPLEIQITLVEDITPFTNNYRYLYDGRYGGGLGYLANSNANGQVRAEITDFKINNVNVPDTNTFFSAVAGDVISFVASNHVGSFCLFSRHNLVETTGGAVSRVKVYDNTTLVGDYDFTTGDQDQIIDTVGNNHATINNANTDKWQPILTKDVYTVGVSGNYPTLDGAVVANKNAGANVIKEFIVSGVISGFTEESLLGEISRFVIRGNTPWDRAATSKPVDGITASSKGTISIGGTEPYGTKLLPVIIRDLYLENSDNAAISSRYWARGSNYQIENCYLNALLGSGISGNYSSADGVTDLVVKNCVIKCYNEPIESKRKTGATSIVDSVLIGGEGGGTYNNGILLANCLESPSVSNIVVEMANYDTAMSGLFKYYGEAAHIANVVTNVPNAYLLADGSGTDGEFSNITDTVDFTGAFVDEAEGDYRINQAWADTNLVNKGQNGSDIVDWAYYVAQGLTSLTKDFSLIVDLHQSETLDFNLSLDLLTSSAKTFGLVTDLLTSISSSKDFNLVADLLGFQEKNFSVVSDLASTSTKDFGLRADLLARTSKPFSVLMDILQSKTSSFEVKADLLQTKVKDFSALLDLLASQSAAVDFNIVVDLLQSTVKTFSSVSELLESKAKPFQAKMDFYGAKIKDFSVNVDLLHSAVVEFLLKTDFKIAREKSFTLTTDLLTSLSSSKDFNLVVDLQGRMTKTFDVELDLLTSLTKDYALVATILNTVTMDFVTRFDLLDRKSKDFTVSVDYLERVGLDFNLVVRIDSETIVTTPAHYTIGVSTGVKFDSQNLSITFNSLNVNQIII